MFTSSQHYLEVSWKQDCSIMLREIPAPFYLCPLLWSGMAKSTGVPDFPYCWRDQWIQSEREKAQQLLREGNLTSLKQRSVPWVGLTAQSCKRKKSGTGEVMVLPCRDTIFSSLAIWEKQKKGFISCFSRVHLSVISSVGWVCMWVCVKENRKKHLVWLHSSHLLIMWLKATVSDNLCF